MRKLVLAVIVLPIPAMAQEEQTQTQDVRYTYGELRYVDTDGSGDGLRLQGSYAIDSNWLIVGGLTDVDYPRGVDSTTIEIGAGYVYDFEGDLDFDLDLVGTLQFVNSEVDTPVGDRDDNGFHLAVGVRAMVIDDFEVRGSVNHVNLDNNDTYLELGGDYYFSERISAGASLEFAGDNDVFTIGARLYFR
jgi:hypothetical protein